MWIQKSIKETLRDLDVDGTMTLEWIAKAYVVRMWTGYMWLGIK